MREAIKYPYGTPSQFPFPVYTRIFVCAFTAIPLVLLAFRLVEAKTKDWVTTWDFTMYFTTASKLNRAGE